MKLAQIGFSMFLLQLLSYPYFCIVRLRNWAFDRGLLRSERVEGVHTIVVGNLSVGGTGKTPHTEWIVSQLLRSGRSCAVLSRGYGRATRGFRLVDAASTAQEVGDEPLQIWRRFQSQGLQVAVCERRVEGLRRLRELFPTERKLTVVLDDAFQHRYVLPDVSLLLTPYYNIYTSDHLLPWGRLREPASGARRANVIIVTKCPPSLSAAFRQRIVSALRPAPWQHVRFTSFRYAPLARAWSAPRELGTPDLQHIFLLSAIANPKPLVEHLQALQTSCEAPRMEVAEYRDHHDFSVREVHRIAQRFHASGATCFVTTEKDLMRLEPHRDLLEEMGICQVWVQRIEVEMLGE